MTKKQIMWMCGCGDCYPHFGERCIGCNTRCFRPVIMPKDEQKQTKKINSRNLDGFEKK